MTLHPELAGAREGRPGGGHSVMRGSIHGDSLARSTQEPAHSGRQGRGHVRLAQELQAVVQPPGGAGQPWMREA
jgi:hypothetical protein